jgi:O-antigen/teichoic acid export membrane protein
VASLANLRRDAVWNVGSLVVLAASGLLLQVLVGLYYDPAVLGAFNQVYAAYILASQLAVLGIHFSVLKHVAQHAEDPVRAGGAILAGLLATVGPAVIAAGGFFLVRGLVGAALSSEPVSVGMAWAAPGLFLFAVNKTQLGAVNGLGHMRAFAVLQTLRPALLVGAFGACALAAFPPDRLPVIFTVAEAGLFFPALIYLLPRLSTGGLGSWIRAHLNFGVRSFLGGVLLDLNTRLDVLVLGTFWSDEVVGVYSFAAIFAEGLFQLLVALRNTVNPLLSKVLHPPDLAGYRALVSRVRRPAWLLVGGLGALGVGIYPLAVHLIPRAAPYGPGWLPFAILVAGVVAVAGVMPFSGILLQAGHPGTNTWVIVGTTVANAALCLALVPFFQGTGAAIATASSFVVQVVLLGVLTRRQVGWQL